MDREITIRKYAPDDELAVWKIIQTVIQGGDTYVFRPDSSKEKMMSYWLSTANYVYVAAVDDQLCGTYFLKANQPDLGSHIANGSYMVHPDFQGRGIGKIMGEHSIVQANQLGFKAIQFNIVVKSNKSAIQLWKKLGFKIIGEIPGAFQHQKLGLVGAFIMFREV